MFDLTAQVVSSQVDSKQSTNSVRWSTHRIFKLLLRAMSVATPTTANNQQHRSTATLECAFGTQRSMVAKFPQLVFGDDRDFDFGTDDDDDDDDAFVIVGDNEVDDDGCDRIENRPRHLLMITGGCASSDRCANLILILLGHCAANTSTTMVRAQAAASLYSLMRQNFDVENVRITYLPARFMDIARSGLLLADDRRSRNMDGNLNSVRNE